MANRQQLLAMLDVIPPSQLHRLDKKLVETGSQARIARCIRNWETVASFLPGIKNDISNIPHDYGTSYELQKIKLLERWLDRNGPFASYRQLAEALNSAGELQALEQLVKELGGVFEQTTPVPTPVPPPAPAATGTLGQSLYPQTTVSTTSSKFYATRALPKPIMRDMLTYVEVTNAYNFGIHLKLDETQLDIIRVDHPNDQKSQRSDVFRLYLQRTEEPSWIQIVDALDTMKENRLAKEIRDIFGIQPKVLHPTSHVLQPVLLGGTQTAPQIDRSPEVLNAENGAHPTPKPKETFGIPPSEPTPSPPSYQSEPSTEPSKQPPKAGSILTHRPTAPGVTKEEGVEDRKPNQASTNPHFAMPYMISIIVLCFFTFFFASILFSFFEVN